MKILNHILYIEFAEMVSAGVSEGYLKKAKSVGTVCWSFIDDPADQRKVLVEYEVLKDVYKALIQAKYGNPYEYIRCLGIKKLLTKDTKAINYYRAYRLMNSKGLPDEHINKYVVAAEWLNMLHDFTESTYKKVLASLGMKSKREFYDACVAIIKVEGVELPHNYTRLLDKLRKYEDDGYKCLISKKFCNNNSEKIDSEAGEWLIGYYSQFTKPTVEQTWLEFNRVAIKRGWTTLRHHESIRAYLYRDGNEQLWYAPRHGQHKANEKFGIQHRTIAASCRDALWFSDGTGLNFYASDSKMQRFYYVMDNYSEVILGWDVQPTEAETVVYNAAKRALEFAGAKPNEWRYDNGGAHKRLKGFFKNVVGRLHFACEPYNGKSKPIENVNLRLQRYFHKQWYFYSGQNRNAKSVESRENEYQLSQLRNELPTFAEILKVVEHDIIAWNNAPHPTTGVSRIQMYQQSVNPKHTEFTELDRVEAFWSVTAEARPYRTEGIAVQIGKTKHLFEVLTANNLPCLDFRRQYIGEKFFVKYDPSDMSYIWLYTNSPTGLQFVKEARTKPATHLAIMDYEEGEASLIRQRQVLKKQEITDRKINSELIQEANGYTPAEQVAKQKTKLRQLSFAEVLRDEDTQAPISLYGKGTDETEILDFE